MEWHVTTGKAGGNNCTVMAGRLPPGEVRKRPRPVRCASIGAVLQRRPYAGEGGGAGKAAVRGAKGERQHESVRRKVCAVTLRGAVTYVRV